MKFVVKKIGTGMFFSPNSSVFPCLYCTTNAPFSFSPTRLSCQTDKPEQTGSFPNGNVSSAIRELWIEKYFHTLLQMVDP
jgi:hypothetical protein